MSDIVDEQNKLLQEYEDTVEVRIELPRVKIEKLISELHQDIVTLSAVPFDPNIEKLNTVKMRSKLAQNLAYFLSLLDAGEEPEAPKEVSEPIVASVEKVVKKPRRKRVQTKVTEKE